jgi:serine protease Do
MDNNEYGFNNMSDDSQNNVNAAEDTGLNETASTTDTFTSESTASATEPFSNESTASTQNTDCCNMYSSYSQPVYEASGKAEKKSKKAKGEKKRPCFFIRAVRGVACAVVIGAVAGASCYGAMYAGYINFPVKGNDELSDEQLSQIARELNKNYLTSSASTGSTLTNVSSNTASSGTTVLDVSGIVDNVISSVVAISGTETVTSGYSGFGFWGNYQQSYEASVSGSGIIIGANDTELLVVTNAHVVDGVNNLKVTFGDGAEVDAVVKGIKSDSDLAVVAVKLADISDSTMSAISIAKLGSSTDVKVGEAAIAIGNAAGYGISVTTGIVSAVDKSLTVDNVVYEDLIQTDAAINPGNSGGALFNAQGEVIGINSVKMTDTKVEGMGYAISIDSVKDIIDDLSTQTTRVALDNDERGYLGVSGNTVTSEISQTYGWPEGVLIKSITEDSAAENAGLEVNDVITSFDGKDVDSWETLVNMMQYYEVGEEVELTYSRFERGSYVENTITVTLTEKPATSR